MTTQYSDHTDWQMMGLIGTRDRLTEEEQRELDLEIERRGYTPEDVAHMERECQRINRRMGHLLSFLKIALLLAPLAVIAWFLYR